MAIRGISETVVGVLGGGQLGPMLCQAANQMAIKVVTLDPLESCPASGIAYHHVVGSFDDGDTVHEFSKRLSVLDFFTRALVSVRIRHCLHVCLFS